MARGKGKVGMKIRSKRLKFTRKAARWIAAARREENFTHWCRLQFSAAPARDPKLRHIKSMLYSSFSIVVIGLRSTDEETLRWTFTEYTSLDEIKRRNRRIFVFNVLTFTYIVRIEIYRDMVFIEFIESMH